MGRALMELYLARSGPKRAFIVAPNKERAQYLANHHLGTPTRRASITRIDDDVVVDTLGVLAGAPHMTRLRSK
jgi:hypothetical protein